ncbi:MAG: helix-turn-helix transcriptional regulator, partial [Myxococcota bacterium]
MTELVCRIQADLDRGWSIGELAAAAGYQEHHFAKLFRAVVGQPPVQYLRRLRLERAAHQLESRPDRTIREVAADAGYAAPEAF